MTQSRREFLARMARGAAYAAPVVVTLSTPAGLVGQGQSQNSQKGGMGKGKDPDWCPPGQAMMGACAPAAQPGIQDAAPLRPPPGSDREPGSVAPWTVRPPGGGE